MESGDLDSGWRDVCRLGGLTAFVSLVCSLATIVVFATLGGPPETAEQTFTLLRDDRMVGLLRLELVSLVNVGVYYFTFFGLYAALRRTDAARATLATGLVFAGVTLWMASHSLTSLITLADRWTVAAPETQLQLVAAGEALIAADMWHSTGAAFGGVLIECGALLLSVIMLRGNVFSRPTAWVGLVTHGLDLLQMLLGIFAPAVKVPIMAVAGPLYLVWFFLIGRRMLQLGSTARAA